MTNLERRALLGDKRAQEEATRKGILLPCPFCGGSAEIEYSCLVPFEYSAFCVDCGIMPPTSGNKQVAISVWNTRPAPPIGRCKDCANTTPGEDVLNHKDVIVCTVYGHRVEEDGLCREFEPKGEKDRDTHRD